jgi:hypothetical protein
MPVLSESKSVRAAIGFHVKSGWATAVLLAGQVESPQVLDQRIVELSDPAIPESRQPHHGGMGRLETDSLKVLRRIQIVKNCTHESVTQLLRDYSNGNCHVCGAALVVGSTIEPSTITNDHIRAHALEGQLFRTVLQETLSEVGLWCSIVVERYLYAQAAAALGRTEGELKRTVSDLGRAQSGLWRVEQKMAALVAWVALAGDSIG